MSNVRSTVSQTPGMLGNVNEVIFKDSDWSQTMRFHGNIQSEILLARTNINLSTLLLL